MLNRVAASLAAREARLAPLARDSLWVLLVWISGLCLAAFVTPNHEGLTLNERIHYVSFTTAMASVVGFTLFKRSGVSRGFLPTFASGVLVLLATLFHEGIVEPYIFRSGEMEPEGFYYTLSDLCMTSVVFVSLRLAASRAGLAAASEAFRQVFDRDSFVVKVSGGSRKIKSADVLYLKAEKDFTRLVCTDREIFASESLKSLLEKSAPFGVMRVHKSFAVNLSRVDRLGRAVAELDGHPVPIGRTYAHATAAAWRAMADGQTPTF